MNNKNTNLGSMKSPLIFRNVVAIKQCMVYLIQLSLNWIIKVKSLQVDETFTKFIDI